MKTVTLTLWRGVAAPAPAPASAAKIWWHQFLSGEYTLHSIDLATFAYDVSTVDLTAYMYGNYPEKWVGGAYDGSQYGYLLGDGSGTTSYLLKIDVAARTISDIISLTQGVYSDLSMPYVVRSADGQYIYTVDVDYSGTERYVLHRLELATGTVDYVTIDDYSSQYPWYYDGLIYDAANEVMYVNCRDGSYNPARAKIDLSTMTLVDVTDTSGDTGAFAPSGEGFVYNGYAYFVGANQSSPIGAPVLKKMSIATESSTFISIGAAGTESFALSSAWDEDNNIAYIGTDSGRVVKFDPATDSVVDTLAAPGSSSGYSCCFWLVLHDGYLYVPQFSSGNSWEVHKIDLATFTYVDSLTDATWGEDLPWGVMLTT